MDWKQLLISITSSVDEELRLRNAYLDVCFINTPPVLQPCVIPAQAGIQGTSATGTGCPPTRA